MSSKPSISIIGSTGGTGLALLRLCLAASYNCTILVRDSEKLLRLLSLTSAPSNLRIITASIRDIPSVQRALLTSAGRLVDTVVSCIGFVPSLNLSKGLNPFNNVDSLTLCEQATKIIVQAIEDVKHKLTLEHSESESEDENGHRWEQKSPLLVVLSTTGITSGGRDIPYLMYPLYHLAEAPHKDKRAMEDYLTSATVPSSQPWVVIRPSLLMGDGKGEATGRKIKVGVEKDGQHEKLAIGYTIKREDVGNWIFREVVEGISEQWVGKAVTLTY